MDAGVPLKKPVAGIAMGMLLGDKGGVSDENAVILSDILGTEDALGTMDFKVAGDRDGITTFQLDIKCEGLTLDTMEKALEQAREGRLHLLDEMQKVLAQPRVELPSTVPKIRMFTVPPETIGKIIGPGGKQIRAIIEDFNLTNMDVDDNGNIQATSMDSEQLEKTEAFVRNLIAEGDKGGKGKPGERAKYDGPEPKVGEIYKGKITGIHPYGVFLEILPGAEDGSTPGLEGLCHVSELHIERVRNCEGFVKSLGVEELEVRFLGVNEKGQLRLSRKDVLENPNKYLPPANGDKDDSGKPSMSDEEIDVIAKAIEGLS
jgi:polyribonucleotide nucleotidyltransferase